MRRSFSLFPLMLAACVPASRPPEAPPAPPPPPRVIAPAPVLPVPAAGSDWRDWPLTPGEWRYRRDARGSEAMFGTLLTLRCDPAERRMVLSLNGAPAAPVTMRASSTARVVPVQPAGQAAVAAFAPTDPLLDALAFSRGRFVVEQAGRPPLVVPAHAEIGRVTEDCRD
ncbi:MAG TPA: hypothetical protein VF592_05315 [Sphingomonas sp.]|jgi:hypothetical protein|uniref:hypothetical protein n=1 Tax=Sphingomonas sp. TaxID=28214 RepID=UPI002ED922B8